MARIISDGKAVELPDGSPVKEAARQVGVMFNCEDGLCATCMSHVLEGEGNLEPKNQKEIDMDLDDGYRLMCQCKVKGGDVKVIQD
jgi:ferredoxin